MQSFNALSAAEAERLALLLEELGETQQAIGKILRHGYESRHPNGGPTNREALERELGDVTHAVRRLIDASDIERSNIDARAGEKAIAVAQYLHHQ